MGKRNRRVTLMDSIERDIAVQLSNAEVRRVFEDGQEHEFTFFNGLFLDGEAINTEVMKPMVLTQPVNTFEEFNNAFTKFTEEWIEIQRKIIFEDYLAVRAAARAGLIVAKEQIDYSKNGDLDKDRCQRALQVLVMCLGAEDDKELESAFGQPAEVNDIFQKFLDDYAFPGPLTMVLTEGANG